MRKQRQFKYPALELIEKYFNMSFTDVINILHIEKKMSINELSKLSKVSRDTFQKNADRLNLKTRKSKEANKINPPRGSRNWMYGRTKESCKVCKNKSELMKKNNPANNNSTRIKMSKSISSFFKKNPLPQEILFRIILDDFNVKYIFQHPINRYVIDFFIPALKLCIEIDSTSKWGKARRYKASIKDNLLSSLGFSVLRINKNLLANRDDIINILQTNYII